MSKHASGLVVLGELGRFSIGHETGIAHIMYWIRLEQGTPNPVLNNAFKECQLGAHTCKQSANYTLARRGLSHIYSNPLATSKGSLKMKSYRISLDKLNSTNTLITFKVCKGEGSYLVSG